MWVPVASPIWVVTDSLSLSLSLSLKIHDSSLHPEIIHRDMELVYEDVLHLNTHNSGEEQDLDFEASLWVHQNIIKLSKELWVCFQGQEREALEFFMIIDPRRRVIKITPDLSMTQSPLRNISKEVKNLETRRKFQKQWNQKRWWGFFSLKLNEGKYCFMECEVE